MLVSAAALLFVTARGVMLTHALRRERSITADELPPPPPSVTVPEPKIPRDTSRPYPRPKGSRSKLNRVCPVCGTGQETGDLDGRILGWPAHRTCAEWLGDWKPKGSLASHQAVPPSSPVPTGSITVSGNLDGIASTGQGSVSIQVSTSPSAQVNVGSGNSQVVWSESGKTDPVVLMTQNGAISPAEARERLNREIVASWGVPPMMLEEHTHKAGDPAPTEQCPKCGARFCGTPDYLRSAFRMHQRTGCRQSSSSPPA